MTTTTGQFLGGLAAGTAALALAACAGPTPYRAAEGPADTGYTSAQVNPNLYRITFEGNEQTDRRTVETYLLYRAAQVTDNTGHDWFAISDRRLEKDVDLDVYTSYRTAPGFYGYNLGYGVGTYPYYSTFPYGASPYATATPVPRVDADTSYRAVAYIEVYEARPEGQETSSRPTGSSPS
ncbi:MAG: hypothetical protein HXY25_00355 [Alphaproteobacteria bacterium]|nr:hypothetical protein [Alphaproteobacteria bacterium]